MGHRLLSLIWLKLLKRILEVAELNDCKILLPKDVVVAVEFKSDATHRIAKIDDVAQGEMILDRGQKQLRRQAYFWTRLCHHCLEWANGGVRNSTL